MGQPDVDICSRHVARILAGALVYFADRATDFGCRAGSIRTVHAGRTPVLAAL